MTPSLSPAGDFSVLMSLYKGETGEHLEQSLHSLCTSTVDIPQVVMVLDGPLPPELHQVLDHYRERLPLTVVVLPVNVGLAAALNQGLEHCRHTWVARFDTDDIIIPDRFLLQSEWLEAHPDLDIGGGYIREFESDEKVPAGAPQQRKSIRAVPLRHEDIVRRIRRRNPFNHMTVMYKKELALALGGYPTEFPYFEDYAFWVRLLKAGARMGNLDRVLVLARAGTNMAMRRRGWHYVKSEIAMQGLLYESGLVSHIGALVNLAVRIPVRLVPARATRWIYTRLLRRNPFR